MVADLYAAGGFVAVHSDIMIEAELLAYPSMIEMRPLYIVVLRPTPEVLAQREYARGHRLDDDPAEIADDADFYDAELEKSPRLGLWLDNSTQTPDETVDEIFARLDEALIT